MKKCDTCGNTYAAPMRIRLRGRSYTFDCFECAIQALAPACAHCGVKILGHGVEVDETIYCSAHCARVMGERGLCDHTKREWVADACCL
jgi:hypothetical protein